MFQTLDNGLHTTSFSHLSLHRLVRKVCASLWVSFRSKLETVCRILVLEAVPLSLQTIISNCKGITDTCVSMLHCDVD